MRFLIRTSHELERTAKKTRRNQVMPMLCCAMLCLLWAWDRLSCRLQPDKITIKECHSSNKMMYFLNDKNQILVTPYPVDTCASLRLVLFIHPESESNSVGHCDS